jgi:hypothetical protein
MGHEGGLGTPKNEFSHNLGQNGGGWLFFFFFFFFFFLNKKLNKIKKK